MAYRNYGTGFIKALRTNRGLVNALRLGVLVAFLSFGISFFVVPSVDAAWSPSGPSVGGGGSGHWTENGFGWKFFPKSEGGPNNGFSDGRQWSSVQAACAEYSGTGVWVHVVRNSRGDERSYNYEGASYNRNRPTSGNDPYYYDVNGNYSPQGRSYQQHVINIIAVMQSRFALEHSGDMWAWGTQVGWFCDGPKETPFTIRAESYIKKSTSASYGQSNITALPGERINWAHDLRAQGNIHQRIYYTIRGSGLPNDFRQPSGDPSQILHSWVDPIIPNDRLFVNYSTQGGDGSYMTYDVRMSDVGNNLCQRIDYQPISDKDGRATSTPFRCVAVPYNYTLTPTITNVTDGNVVESNEDALEVIGSVRNNGPTKSVNNTRWEITQIEYSVPLTSIPNRSGSTNTGSNPCDFFTGEIRCNRIANGNEASGISYPGQPTYPSNGDLANKPAGTKICFVMSVQPVSSSSGGWSHSPMRCLVIGKKPKVQVLAGDLLVGRAIGSNPARMSEINTSVSRTGGRYYGSWAEHAILPSGCVTGMASGSGYAAGGAVSNNFSNLSILSFTTLPSGTCATNVGRYVHVSSAPDVSARFPINVPHGGSAAPSPAVLPSVNVTLSDLANQYQAPSTAADINVRGGSDIPRGRQVVINAPNATVHIVDNIRYTNESLGALADIPQVVIIARNIVIADNVTQIDAWLVATGTGTSGVINTCAQGAPGITTSSPLTINTCNAQLVVNGPVIANHLVLRRTFGADQSSRGDASEVFNLRPDSYLWATAYNLSSGRISTAQTKELPPRF